MAVHRQFRSPLLREKKPTPLASGCPNAQPAQVPSKTPFAPPHNPDTRLPESPLPSPKTPTALKAPSNTMASYSKHTTPSIRLQAILSRNQPRPHRIQMNIIEYRPISISRLHHDRLVSSSKKMPPQPVPRIDPPRVGILKPPHAHREIRLRRFQEQMVVITHQRIRMNPKPRPIANLSQRSRFELVLA